MKTKFIRIDDVSEIDTSKIGIFDLANRYIDKYGNMYGLRYNRDVKKIEVVKIMRTQKKHATYFSQKIQMRPEKQWSLILKHVLTISLNLVKHIKTVLAALS